MMLPTSPLMFVPNSAKSVFNDHYCRMTLPSSHEEVLPPAVNDAVAILIALATAIHDWHRDTFHSALSDLQRQIRIAPSVIRSVRCLLARELNVPYCSQWRVTEMEYERRRRLVFLSLRELHATLDEASGVSQFERP